jgi:UDP-N-acetylmuramate--alanine ligase
MKEGLDLKVNVKEGVSVYSYGMEKGDFHAENIKIENATLTFDFVTPTTKVENIELGVPVQINVENAVGAMALATLAGVQSEELRAGMKSFKGIKRRFDMQIQNERLVYIDDYAHHPEELRASIKSVRSLYPMRRICGVFQPHLYSRTRDFAAGFAEVLSMLDEVILLDIYPARELPIEGITSDIIFQNITIENKSCATMENLLEILKSRELDVLVTFGAGDIGALVPKIKTLLDD